LFQGAISKVILAYLPHYRLKAIYPRYRVEIENAGMGNTWKAFRTTLGEIKKNGYHLTVGEFNPGVIGVAAPILDYQKTAIGSVGVAWDEHRRRDVEVEQAVRAVQDAATTISTRLMQQ
jgi:DNA-binding IclR family transcriptional regulator